ncbi:MAG: hypothetical protein KGH94_04330 [Candidatus Micrarchaeota archaeon]|nr:hypothetical protein [Candidatus Micrarchaeota archaeon]
MAKAYRFDARVHLDGLAIKEYEKGERLQKNNPFIPIAEILRASTEFSDLKAWVPKRCTTDGRGCITAYGITGNVIATGVADALKKIKANMRNGRSVDAIDYLKLDECKVEPLPAMKARYGKLEIPSILTTFRSYEWDQGFLRRDNYVAQKFKPISGDTKLYAIFEQTLRT